MSRNRLRSVLWQVFSGLVGLLVAFAALSELLWWCLYLYDHSNVTPYWSWIVHLTALAAIALLAVERATLATRQRAIAMAGGAAMPEDPVWTVHIASFPVEVQWSFAAFLILCGSLTGSLLRGAVVAIAAAASILAHELGHATVARRLRRGNISIVLHWFGGATFFDESRPTRGESIAVALAGPAVGVFFGLLLLSVGDSLPGMRGPLFNDLLLVTLGWSALNLLPIYPLDGSTLLAAAVRRQSVVTSTSLWLSVGGAIISIWVRAGILVILFASFFVTNVLVAFPSLQVRMSRLNRRLG